MWTRRALIKNGTLGLVSLSAAAPGFGPAFLSRTAAATPPLGRPRVLVTIFQRGAMDGLMAVTPVGEEKLLRKYRPRLEMGAAQSAGDDRMIDLGSGFGLHPGFEALLPAYKEGRLAVVHEVGSPDPTRSHFDAQDYMESGTPGRKGTPSGWLNRVSGLMGHEATPFRSVSMTAALPRSLYGEQPALAVSRLEDFQVRLPGAGSASGVAGRGFEALYADASQELLREAGSETFEAVDLLKGLDLAAYRPAAGVRYPNGELGRSLRQIAQLIKAGVGLEIAFAETGGWDTHVQQGTSQGSFGQRSRDLAQSIEAFWLDLGQYRDSVVVMTMTEFGRTVRENGSGGTDHGHGSCLFVLGNDIDGGKIHGAFDGLNEDRLYEGRDLPVTTDFRAVFAGVAENHLGVSGQDTIFPGWNGKPLSLMRG